MIVTFPIKTVSEANTRQHWRMKYNRKKAQQQAFVPIWRNAKVKVELPCQIIFTRYSTHLLDSDNLVSAFKATRDALAREIGIDDGSSQIEWIYRQARIPKREHYFTVEVKQ